MQSKIFLKKTSHPLYYKDLKIELGWNKQIYAINIHRNKKNPTQPAGIIFNFLSSKSKFVLQSLTELIRALCPSEIS